VTVHVRVRVGKEHYALPVENVLEIAELGEISPVPGSGSAILGVRNLRGQVLPVFELAAILGLDSQTRPVKLVVAEADGRRAGLAIDEVTDVRSLSELSSNDPDSAFLTGSVIEGDQLVGLIDVGPLFAALEERAVR
jgi:purine-binding chemotaxis protein CheW